jgi:hypothetical protein
MFSISVKHQNTAKGVLSLLGLAVLFFSLLTLIEFWTCPPAEAVGLQIGLVEKDRNLVRFGYPPWENGLTISSDSIALLKTSNLRLKQSVLVEYKKGFVSISEKKGQYQLYKPLFLTLESYTSLSNRLRLDYEWRRNLNTHFLRSGPGSGGLLEWEIPVKFPKMVSKIIGEGGPALKVQGYRKITFSGRSMWEDGLVNTATSRQSKFPSLQMEQYSSFKITGTIGSKITVQVDQDSRRHTDLENTIQLRYKGYDDEIIQSIEAGNTNLRVGSGVVGYSERKQGLFGIKTTAKVGGWDLTMITSQDKGSTQKAEFSAGARTSTKIIRDYEYLERTFYWLGYGGDFAEEDSIVEIRLFKNNVSISSNTAEDPAPYGIAYVDPSRPQDSYPEDSVYVRFKEIDQTEYFIQRNQHWIQFFTALGRQDILAVYYEVLRPDGSIDTVGFLEDSCTAEEGEICYKLKLIKPETPKPNHYTWDYEWKNVYYLGSRSIERDGFHLDIYRGPRNAEDISVDPNYQDSTTLLRILGLDELDLNADTIPDGIVDYRLIDFGLGYLQFLYSRPFSSENPTLKVTVDTIYTTDVVQDKQERSEYYIQVQYSSRQSQFHLGHAPIIEGSDVVTLNGAPLQRDLDYTITYETGEITFMNPDALSPTAELVVDYEYAPLLMPEKKSMFGMMAEYSLGRNFKFGAVGIYKSQKTAEERPRVGQEPTRNFVWGSNLTFSSSAPLVTKIFNNLPWVEADAPSTIDFKGDIAQSVPNPNTKNQAFVDDFEGSLQYTDLSIRRGTWTLCSPPDGKELSQRCRLWWYNPYDQVEVTDIWPYKETERNQERTNVLEVSFSPKESHRPSNQSFDTTSAETNWNGVMRSLYPGAYNQTRSKFLEIWVKGGKGILHVDLGRISEDLDGDRVRDTEDKVSDRPEDGILDDDEDLGLDGLIDTDEKDLYNSSLPDPSGDNWSYDYENRYDYSQINGTEGNRNDPDRSRRPDTEDINTNSVLDEANDYFEFSVDLSKKDFVAEQSYPNDSANWRLYRIPLMDPLNYQEVGSPDWSEIRFARIWVSSAENCIIRIASIQLVGNRWENQGITSVTDRQTPLPIGAPADEEFEIFVVNTHENPRYTPPSGIAGTLDRQTNVREKEQSLVLKYENLRSNHQGEAQRVLYKPENYTKYRYLKMYVHGPDEPGGVTFFLRFGSNASNFYEYHTKIYPGWDDRNEVLVDLDQITALKAYALNTRPPTSREPIDTTAGSHRVKGSPSLTKIGWYSMGVINDDTISYQPISGEIWADELRVTDVRKEKGLSGKIILSSSISDLAKLNFTFNQTDAEYRSLTQTQGSGRTRTDYSFNLNGIQVHRFLPVSLGYMLPVTLRYTHSQQVPKWKSGSDILLPKDLRDQEKQEGISKSISFTPSFSHTTQNWLLNSTLKRINHSFSYNTSRNTSLQVPVQTQRSTIVNAGYSFPFGRGLPIKPFGWLQGALIPRGFTQLSLSFLPTSLSVNGGINESRTHKVTKVGEIYDTHTKNFSGNLSSTAIPIGGIPLTYSMSTNRDIIDPKTIKYSLNPKNAKLGIETNYSEAFSARLNPSWLSTFNASFTFESSYRENADRLDNHNAAGTRTVSNGNKKQAGFTFDWKKILGQGGSKPDEQKKPSIFNPLHLLRKLTQRIDPVRCSYSKNETYNKSGLMDRPNLGYRLGFSDDPQVGRKGDSQSTDRVNIQEGYSAKSGIRIFSTSVGTDYSKSISRTITATDATKNVSTRFPNASFSFNKLGNLPLLKQFFTSVSYNFGYSRQVDERESERTGQKLSKSTGESFSPLASFSFRWKNGIQTTVKISRSNKTDENLQGYGGNQSITKSFNNSIDVTSNYSFRAPQGIKLPIFGKVRFTSAMNISLRVSKTSHKAKSAVAGNAFNVTTDNSKISITSSANYSFSSQLTGGMNLRWDDSNDKKAKRKTHLRELGIWMQISF